ncbi:hypothetical protein [Leucobacter chromiireducens]|uniref:hypothetical protein n=1 Tax=Leucobacter chromiireducens TaxID=283877 RepID=UPI003F7E5848
MSQLRRSAGLIWVDDSHPLHDSGVTAWRPARDELTLLASDPALAHFAAHRLYGVAEDGGVLALGTDTVFRGANRTDLTIGRRDGTVLLHTRDFLVYGVVFAHDARVILLESFKNKPRRFVFNDATDHYEDAGVLARDFRQHAGGLDPRSERFVAAAQSRTAGRVVVTDLATGEVAERKLKLGLVHSVTFVAGGDGLIVRSGDAVVTRYSRDWEVEWHVDGASWHGAPPRDQPELGTLKLGADVFETGDGSLLCVAAASTMASAWGTEYLLDPASGEVLHHIDASQGRGRVVGPVAERELLLFTGHTLSLPDGTVSGLPAAPFRDAH